jgi:hypothetical protein
MDTLQYIIDQLRLARAELAASNNKHINLCDCDACNPHRMPERNVPYHHSRQAMLDAGHHERDFG